MKQHFLFIDDLDASEANLLSFEKNLLTGSARRISLESLPHESLPHESLPHEQLAGEQLLGEPLSIHEEDQLNVVLSDRFVSSYELRLTARNQAQLNKAARFAVEEKFPGALEDYQIVTHKASKQSVSVRAIQLTRLQGLLAHLARYTLKPDAIFVESDLLNRNIATLLLSEHEATLCGADLEQNYEFDSALVPILAEKIFSTIINSPSNGPDLHIIYPDDQSLIIEALQNQAPDTIRIKKIPKDEQYYKVLCNNRRAGINLLQGEFSVSDKEHTQGSHWAYPAWLTLTAGLVFTGGSLAQNLVLEHRISLQEAELIQSYTQAFPGVKAPRDITDLGNKLRAKLSTAASPVSNSLLLSPLELLNSTARAAATHPVQILGLTLDNNLAEILVSANSVEVLDGFKNALQSEIGSDKNLNMDAVNAKDDRYQGKISIR